MAISNLMGFHLMRGNEILCEALTESVIQGTREPGVGTRNAFLQRGFTTTTRALLIDFWENVGRLTWRNRNKTNLVSAALASKCGCHEGKQYQLFAWLKKG
jgi:hypothetical protein